jgi:CRP-like cAMP-binding protein
MQNRELDFRVFAREACPVIDVQAGATVFQLGEPGATMYVILSGRIDMVNGDRVIESLGVEAAFGLMSHASLRGRTRNPVTCSNFWIPGSREGARPGMTR